MASAVGVAVAQLVTRRMTARPRLKKLANDSSDKIKVKI
jgi:hypothetical protein